MRCSVIWGLALALLLGGAGCGGDVPESQSSADTGSSGGAGASSDEAPATGSAPTSEDTAAETTGGPDGATSTGQVDGEGSTGDAGLVVDVEVVTFAEQPMVVDLVFSVPELSVTVEHARDPGVFARVLPEFADGETRVRVRGLAPQTEHTLSYLASDGSGDAVADVLTLQTEPALPGFVAAFAVQGDGPAFDGYALLDMVTFGLQTPSSIFAVDATGTTRWHHGVLDAVVGIPIVHAAATLRADGTVLYVRDDTIVVRDELGTAVVELAAGDLGLPGLHHEVLQLPGGNFLSLSYVFEEVDYPDLGPTWVAGDLIVEVTPEGDVVWQWDAFDHLDPLRRRDGFETIIVDPDAMLDAADWTHGNGLVYDATTDTILLCLRHQDWVVAIDRSTSDVLWRLGDEGDFTLSAGDWFFHPHSPQWQDDGTLLLYDNGVGNPFVDDPDETSRVARYSLDPVAMTAALVWEDEADDFVSAIAGDANRLPDGSILVTDSAIDDGEGNISARVRKIDEAMSMTPQWSLQTGLGQLVYRASIVDRLVGEAR